MNKEVLVKAIAKKVHPSGDVDVEVYIAADGRYNKTIITVLGAEVLQKPLFTHWSDCSLHSDPADPTKPCDCRVGLSGNEE